jgi:hypothetical protein
MDKGRIRDRSESFNEVCGRRPPKRSLSMPAYKSIGLEIARLMAKDTGLFSWKERLERGAILQLRFIKDLWRDTVSHLSRPRLPFTVPPFRAAYERKLLLEQDTRRDQKEGRGLRWRPQRD